MGSRFQFQIMTEAEALAVLDLRTDQAEVFADKIRAQHRLRPVTKLAERAASKAYEPSAATFGCSSCGRFAFAQPTLCFYCRRESWTSR